MYISPEIINAESLLSYSRNYILKLFMIEKFDPREIDCTLKTIQESIRLLFYRLIELVITEERYVLQLIRSKGKLLSVEDKKLLVDFNIVSVWFKKMCSGLTHYCFIHREC